MNQFELLPECPFYMIEGKKGVKCESPVKGSSLGLNFRMEKSFNRFRDAYCYSMDWEKCPIAKMLNDKYEAERWGK